MTRKSLIKLLTGLFLAGFITLLALFNATKPRLLVLHSFAERDPWIERTNAGMQKALKQNRNPLTVRYHYLDILSLTDNSRLQVALNGARQAIDRYDPDLLIAVDDEINQLLVSSLAGKKRPKILYLSTLEPPERYGYSVGGNGSGIMELLPLAALEETISILRGGRPARIAVLGMDNPTGRAELRQVQQFAWKKGVVVSTCSSNSFDKWRSYIAGVRGRADILLLLSYDGLLKDADGRETVAGKELIEWIEHNSEPLPLSIDHHYCHDGGGLSISPSPSDFGMQGMQMALDWIAARKGEAAPEPRRSEHFSVGMRQSVLAARGVTLPVVYREAARQADALFP